MTTDTPTSGELQEVAKFLLEEYVWRQDEADRWIGEFMDNEPADYHFGNWISPEVRAILCNIDPDKMRDGLKRLYKTHPFYVCDKGSRRSAVHPLLLRLANLLAAPSRGARDTVAEALQHGSYDVYEELENSDRIHHFTLDLLVQAWGNLIALLTPYFEEDGCTGEVTLALCCILNATRGAC